MGQGLDKAVDGAIVIIQYTGDLLDERPSIKPIRLNPGLSSLIAMRAGEPSQAVDAGTMPALDAPHPVRHLPLT